MTQIIPWVLGGLLVATLAPISEAGADNLQLPPSIDGPPTKRDFEPVVLEQRTASLDPTIPIGGLFGNDAGCDAGGTTRYAQEGTPSSGCMFATHRFGVHYTAVRCLQSCFTQIWNSGVWYSGAEVSCGTGGIALVDWEQETVENLQGACSANFFGDHPTDYANWWSRGNGKWSHTDNLADALFHLGA